MMVMCTKVIAFEWLSGTKGQNIVEELQKQKMIINNCKIHRLRRGLIDQEKEEWKGIKRNMMPKTLVEELFFATCFMQLHMSHATFFICIRHM